jgi:hypothetical protein
MAPDATHAILPIWMTKSAATPDTRARSRTRIDAMIYLAIVGLCALLSLAAIIGAVIWVVVENRRK